MSEAIWETFDGLFKTLYRQGEQVEQLERRVVELERRLQERPAHVGINGMGAHTLTNRFEAIDEDYPAERAA